MNSTIKKIFIFPILGAVGLMMALGPLQIRSMPSLIHSKELFAEEARISISVKPLTSDESDKYLQSPLPDLGYRPVQITIENQTPYPYLIDESSVSLKLASSKKVASAAHGSAIPATIGFKIAGFIFWPFSILGTMHSIKRMESHHKIKQDFFVKSVKEEIIPPYTTMNRVFFVEEEEFKDSFSVTLINQETLESKIFPVANLKEEEPAVLAPIPMPEENYYLTHEK